MIFLSIGLNTHLVFSVDSFSNLIGMIDLNAANIESLPSPSIRKQLSHLLKCAPDETPSSLGMGLFKFHSCLNHSCQPNAQVVGGLRITTDAKIQVVALDTINPGEEVVISYIDDPQTKPKSIRQKELEGGYLFTCRCKICEIQK